MKSVQDLLEATRDVIGYAQALGLQRRLAALAPADREGLFRSRLQVVIGGNCSVEFLAPGLAVGLAAEGIDGTIRATDYDSWIASVLDDSADGAGEGDAWVIWLSSMGASDGGTARRGLPIATIAMAAKALLDRGAKLVAILPEALEAEADPYSPFAGWRRDLVAELDASLPADAVRLDPASLQRQRGVDAWTAGRYWTSAKCPCHPDAATALAKQAAMVIARLYRPAVRAVITDLDNTLWGGIVGEDGVDGLELDPHGEGRPYLQMQRFLKDLSESGVPVCVVSKNEPEDAAAPFDRRAEMILSRQDMVHFRAGWGHKHEAIRDIAEALNLGLESVCFLDDSPHERAEARAFLPDLMVPEVAEDPESRVGDLIASGLFMTPVVQAGDRARVAFYRSESERQSLAATTTDYGAYLESLGMVLSPRRVGPDNLARVTSLVHKTNQFNLVGRRHGSRDIARMAEDERNYAFCFATSDRFGDAGIIAVLIGLAGGEAMEIDTWLMSCRVLKRGVEFAIFEHFVTWIGERGMGSVDARFVPSKRNGMVAEFYDELGFTRLPEEGPDRRYRLESVSVPRHYLEIAA